MGARTPAGTSSTLASAAPLVLVAAAVAAYWSALDGPFVFDDHGAIVRNAHIRSLWPPLGALTAPEQSPLAGRPLASLSFALSHAVSGLDARGYRGANLVLHALCAIALFGVVRRALSSTRLAPRFGAVATPLAFATALVWAVHPLTSECVAYATQRTESLMALCLLLTLYASLRAWPEPGFGRWHGAATLACLLGMGAKESMATAPLLVVLFDLCLREQEPRAIAAHRKRLYLALAACWIPLAALNVWGPRSASIGGPEQSFVYLLNQCEMLVRYLRLVVWPDPLVLDYGLPRPLALADVAAEAALLLSLLAATGFGLWRRSVPGLIGAWMFVLLAPTSSVVPILSEVGAERRMYLPLAAPCAWIVCGGWCWLAGRTPHALRIVLGGATALSLALGAATHARGRDYRSEIAIWQSSVAAWPDNARAHGNLGLALQRRNPRAAIARFEHAIGLDPDFADAHHNLGNTLRLAGRLDEALVHTRRAIELDPNNFDALNNLGSIRGAQGRIDQAVAAFERAVAIAPGSAATRANLAHALALRGDHERARGEFERSIALAPHAAAHLGLAELLIDLGERDEAIANLERAAALDPGWAEPRQRLERLRRRAY